MSKLSVEASLAMFKGANAMCPGCKIEQKVPTNVNGAALHYMHKDMSDSYECHANSDAWKDVPEFREQQSAPTGM